jgi:hypothetical protein
VCCVRTDIARRLASVKRVRQARSAQATGFLALIAFREQLQELVKTVSRAKTVQKSVRTRSPLGNNSNAPHAHLVSNLTTNTRPARTVPLVELALMGVARNAKRVLDRTRLVHRVSAVLVLVNSALMASLARSALMELSRTKMSQAAILAPLAMLADSVSAPNVLQAHSQGLTEQNVKSARKACSAQALRSTVCVPHAKQAKHLMMQRQPVNRVGSRRYRWTVPVSNAWGGRSQTPTAQRACASRARTARGSLA